MELEIYDALTAAGVPADKAKIAVESIDKAIDRRYTLHHDQLATRGDLSDLGARLSKELADVRADTIKWCVASIFGSVAMFAAIVKLLH